MEGDLIRWKCEVTRISDRAKLSEPHARLIQKAKEVSKLAYAKYSQFYVGASLLLEDGSFVLGCNQENAAFPLGTCAEQVVLHNAWVNHPGKRILALAVFAESHHSAQEEPVSPCGACRQVITEFEHIQDADIELFLCGSEDALYHVSSAKVLLPFYFDGSALKPPRSF